jgi:hypothetical protein
MLVGAIVYIGVLLVLKTIDKEDRLIINKIMKN